MGSVISLDSRSPLRGVGNDKATPVIPDASKMRAGIHLFSVNPPQAPLPQAIVLSPRESTSGFDGIKTVLYLLVLSHVVTQNRCPLLRNML